MTKAEILNRFNITEAELCKRVEPQDHEIVFLSGSLFDGLGNARSDLDIFLITDDRHPLLRNERTIDQNVIVDNRRYDLSIFSYSLVDETAEVLKGLDFTNHDIYFPRQLHAQVSNYEICTMVHRLKIGMAIHNHQGFEQLLKQFPFSSYVQWLIRLRMNEYDGLYEDIVGSLESQDLLTAGELMQQQLHLLAQLLVLSVGQTFDRDKWVLRKLSQVVQQGLLAEDVFQNFLTNKKAVAVGEKPEILKAMQFCERQIETLQLGIF